MFIDNLKRIIPFLIAVILIALVISAFEDIHLKELFQILQETPLKLLMALVLMQVFTFLLIIVQWRKTFVLWEEKIPYKTLLKMNLIGYFYEAITPTVKIGGEAFKVLYLKEQGYEGAKAVSAVFVQKAISMIAFLSLSIASWLYYVHTVNQVRLEEALISINVWVVITIIAILIILILLFSRTVIYNRYIIKIRNSIRNIKIYLASIKTQKKKLLEIFLFAVIIWMFYAVKAHFIFKDSNFSLSFLQVMSITFISYFIAMMPISIGGVGTFEIAMLMLLHPFALPQTNVLYAVILFRFITYWLFFIISTIYILLRKLLIQLRNKNV